MSKSKQKQVLTEHSRLLRVRTAAAHQKEIVAAGGRRLAVLLYPAANAALAAEMARTSESAAAIINRMLESLEKK